LREATRSFAAPGCPPRRRSRRGVAAARPWPPPPGRLTIGVGVRTQRRFRIKSTLPDRMRLPRGTLVHLLIVSQASPPGKSIGQCPGLPPHESQCAASHGQSEKRLYHSVHTHQHHPLVGAPAAGWLLARHAQLAAYHHLASGSISDPSGQTRLLGKQRPCGFDEEAHP
jgi:hypothetical protein